MSVQVTQGLFAETAPNPGEIKVLYKNQNGLDNVRAITISNVDLNGNNVKLSLDAVEQIRTALNSGSLAQLNQEQLTVITRAAKPRTGNNSYYYIDLQDTFLTNQQNLITTTTSRTVNLTPYLSEPFFNNDYNAIISNADKTRTSVDKFDVDRGGGFVFPTNYPAVAGIGEYANSNLKYEDATGAKILTETTFDWAPANNYYRSSSITDSISVANDRDVTIKVEKSMIGSALGNLNIPILKVANSDAYTLTHTLTIEIDKDSSFNPASQKYSSGSLVVQTNENGAVDHIVTPFERSITSGSMGTGFIHIRLKQNNLINTGGTFGNSATLTTFYHTSADLPQNLPVRFYYNTQAPYAPSAPVQDSNYTHTGHINARYNGTKTNEIDFSGISSAVAGTVFEGAAYIEAEVDGAICSQSLSDRNIEQFIFEGTGDLPVAQSENIGTVDSSDVVAASNDTQFAISTFFGKSILVGDVLRLTNGVNTEVVQVLTVNQTVFGKFPVFTVTVTRNYDSAGLQAGFAAGSTVDKTAGSRIFRPRGNRLVPIGRQKVWIKDNRTIVKTNDRGFVTELSTTCTV